MQVTTEYGMLAGLETADSNQFLGVPYAAEPVGAKRFKAPSPPQPWTGVRKADTKASCCPQEASMSFYEKEFRYKDNCVFDEDCLYLNIWAPKNAQNCPVAFWIHGGALTNGCGTELEFDGDAYARRGVMLVTINYRLGIFGFFSHPQLALLNGHSGNNGLLDQIAALDWVRANIASFGGDPDNITIFGQSAGGMSVMMLSCSPLARGKYRRAIIQSSDGYQGGAHRWITLSKQNELIMDYLAKNGKTLSDLMSMPWQELQKESLVYRQYTQQKIGRWEGTMPVLDDYVLPRETDEAVDMGETRAESFLIGCNGDDMAAIDQPVEESPMYKGAMNWCLAHEKRGIPCYMYLFDRKMPGDDAGAFHSAELWYMFGTVKRCWRPLTEADEGLSRRMLDAWCGFMRDGNPGWDTCTKNHPYVKLWNLEGKQKTKHVEESI